MSNPILEIKSITQLHEGLGFEKPKHPLISIIDASKVCTPPDLVGQRIMSEMYMIALKDKSCGMEYGRNLYDFDEGCSRVYCSKTSSHPYRGLTAWRSQWMDALFPPRPDSGVTPWPEHRRIFLFLIMIPTKRCIFRRTRKRHWQTV